MTLLVSPGNFANRAIMKEAFEAIFFIHLTRKNAAFTLRTLKRMGSNNQNKTRCNPREKTNAGAAITTRPKVNAKPGGQNRKAGKMNPSRQLWIISDSIILPFLIPFLVLAGVMLELENDPFHAAMRVMPMRARVPRKSQSFYSWQMNLSGEFQHVTCH